MTPSDESQVLQWFERALEQPTAERRAWLQAQSLPPWLHLRVLRLLEAESNLGGFLEEPATPPEPDGFPKLGERVGNYQLVDRIDSGGMGVVFLARRADDTYEQQVAVKLIRPLHLSANAGFRAQLVARFENERALLARLSHPNIARILDGGSTTSGIPWLAMEHVAGGLALTDYCDRNTLDIATRLRLCGTVGTQEITRVEPGGFHAKMLQHGGHQARRPHFTMANHFRIHRIVNTTVEQRRQAFQIADKSANEAIGFFSG